ncbi:MAG: PAS domain-containing protein [Rhodospirillales bacterium]|nr:PAS domain-containing protein [Rhodospirillales bacterium]
MTPDFCAQIRHPQLRQLYTYWASRRRGRGYPARADIDLADIRFAIGNLILIDVLYEPLRFRFRLMGTLAIQRLGWDLTGRMVDDIPDATYRDYILGTYKTLIATREPSVAVNERVIDGKAWQFEVLRLPLSDNDETINMLLICPLYFDAPPARSPLSDLSPGDIGPPRIIEDP